MSCSTAARGRPSRGPRACRRAARDTRGRWSSSGSKAPRLRSCSEPEARCKPLRQTSCRGLPQGLVGDRAARVGGGQHDPTALGVAAGTLGGGLGLGQGAPHQHRLGALGRAEQLEREAEILAVFVLDLHARQAAARGLEPLAARTQQALEGSAISMLVSVVSSPRSTASAQRCEISPRNASRSGCAGSLPPKNTRSAMTCIPMWASRLSTRTLGWVLMTRRNARRPTGPKPTGSRWARGRKSSHGPP